MMLFSNILTPLDIADIFMNNIKIDYASSLCFLGVIIDDKLKFNLHINEITKKISKNTGILYKLREVLPSTILLSVYRSIVESYLNYCNLIFGNASAVHLSPLVIAQKKAIRIIANQPPRSHTNPIFSALNLLKAKDFYTYNLGIYMKKNESNFAEYYRINLNNTRSGDHYVPPHNRLALSFNQSINRQAPNNWLSIPPCVRNSPSLLTFKRNYKKHIISGYLSDNV